MSRLAWLLPSLLAALAGCAAIDARRLATEGAPAWELRGSTLASLDRQAQGLCPKGFDTVQQWEHRRPVDVDANIVRRWGAQAAEAIAPSDEARLVVQCRG